MKKREAMGILRKHLDHHKLYEWEADLQSKNLVAATCSYSSKRILLSRWFIRLNTCKRITETITHEIAHALVGGGNGHNQNWAEKCRQIGLQNPREFFDESDTVFPKSRYEAECYCGNMFRSTRKRKSNGFCAICYNPVRWYDTKKEDFIDFSKT